MMQGEELLGEHALGKLRWRCRRGLLENDLLIERFFEKHGQALTVSQARGLTELMELSDNDLLDLLLRRPGAAAIELPQESRSVLEMLRPDVSRAAGREH